MKYAKISLNYTSLIKYEKKSIKLAGKRILVDSVSALNYITLLTDTEKSIKSRNLGGTQVKVVHHSRIL